MDRWNKAGVIGTLFCAFLAAPATFFAAAVFFGWTPHTITQLGLWSTPVGLAAIIVMLVIIPWFLLIRYAWPALTSARVIDGGGFSDAPVLKPAPKVGKLLGSVVVLLMLLILVAIGYDIYDRQKRQSRADVYLALTPTEVASWAAVLKTKTIPDDPSILETDESDDAFASSLKQVFKAAGWPQPFFHEGWNYVGITLGVGKNLTDVGNTLQGMIERWTCQEVKVIPNVGRPDSFSIQVGQHPSD